MAGASLKLWKAFTNIGNTKSVLTNKCFLPAQQSIACVKHSADKTSNLPEKPKRPTSAYVMYYTSIFQKLSEQNPGSPVKEIAKLAGQSWKTCDPSVKSMHQENFKKSLAAYESAKENYEAKLTPDMKAEILAANQKARKATLKKKQKKDQKELGRPPKPSTPWTLFLKTKAGQRGDQPFPEWVKQLAKEWNSIDMRTKSKQNEDYQLALSKYHVDLNKWEEEMIRSGRPDLVRQISQIKPKKKASKKLKAKSKSKSRKSKSAKTAKADKEAAKK